MNKKGEAITIAVFLLLLLVLGVLYYQNILDNKQFIGDSFNKTIYNLKSDNPQCDFNKIKIERENIVLFSDFEEAQQRGYKRSTICP